MTAPESLYTRTLQARTDLYNTAIVHGTDRPFIYPWDTLPALCLILGIACSPRLPSALNALSRYLLTIAAFWYCLAHQNHVRTLGLTAGYGIGLSASWGLIMTVVLLVLHNPGKDFKRLELKELDRANGHQQTIHVPAPEQVVFWNIDKKLPGNRLPRLPTYVLAWQGYPVGFWHVVDWTSDLMTSFRGMNWNFHNRIPTQVVPRPQGDPPKLPPTASKQSIAQLQALQKQAVYNFVFWYVLTDLVKTIAVTDTFLLGIADLDSPTPWQWLETLNAAVPGATALVRLCFSLCSVVTAISLIFSLSPLFFPLLLPYLLRSKIVHVTRAPLLEAWMYPPYWGPMFRSLGEKGLSGMWGTWWHQMFRYGISEPSRLLVKWLGIHPRGRMSRAIQILVAFTVTGLIHAAASSTTFSIVPSRPADPFWFFFCQGLGILAQSLVSGFLNSLFKFPRVVKQASNLAFVVLFLWYTAPLLVADFARCGIWLFEPLPVTFVRGLGFGPGDCWFPWLALPEGGRTLGWWSGDRWYRTGIAIY